MYPCAEFGEACVAGSGPLQVRLAAVSGIIDYDPAPVPGPVASRRSPLEALSSSCVDFDAAAAEPTISSFSGA